MNLAQAIGYQPGRLTEPRLFGRPRTVLCQGRGCPSRTAPVLISPGVKGILLLCHECRAYQVRIARATLSWPATRRRGMEDARSIELRIRRANVRMAWAFVATMMADQFAQLVEATEQLWQDERDAREVRDRRDAQGRVA